MVHQLGEEPPEDREELGARVRPVDGQLVVAAAKTLLNGRVDDLGVHASVKSRAESVKIRAGRVVQGEEAPEVGVPGRPIGTGLGSVG